MTKKLALHLDFRSGLPIYTQIVNQVQSHLVQGSLKVGDQLPTIRALADDLSVNFNTIARAYRILDKARVISTQQGRGTYITEIPSGKVKAQLRDESLSALAQSFIAEALRLGFSKQEISLVVKDKLSWVRSKG
jgi:GntR family transcriptional regulator